MEYKLAFTVNSDKEHPPITFSVSIPESAAFALMAAPATSVGLALSVGSNIVGKLDGLPLLDFK